MNPKPLNRRGRSTKGPEAQIEQEIIDMLKIKDWFVQRLHGSTFQAGMPDLFACTKISKIGIVRLIEVKDPNRTGNVFTPAQHEMFPKICANGGTVHVMTAATEEQYQWLFKPSNWYQFLQDFRKEHGH